MIDDYEHICVGQRWAIDMKNPMFREPWYATIKLGSPNSEAPGKRVFVIDGGYTEYPLRSIPADHFLVEIPQ